MTMIICRITGKICMFLLVVWTSHAVSLETQCDIGDPCTISKGSYHVSYPMNWDGVKPLPAVIFFHGHGSSGANVLKRKKLRAAVNDAGYLLIAPNGISWPGHSASGWAARTNAPTRRNDVLFTSSVLDDVARRLPLARDRVLVSGYSSGGSMAWHVGCYSKERFAGYVSIAGGLRRPNPAKRCPRGPFRMLHFHGFKDRQVPLEGRRIRGDWHQGDVFESLSLLRTTNECRSNPKRYTSDSTFQCRIWDGCASGNDIQFCLHDGGHTIPDGWLSRSLHWFAQGDGS